MNVLIYGAGNSIAIFIARYLQSAGHTPILADHCKYSRGFYSRYCKKKYMFRNPANDRGGFFEDLRDCLKRERVELLLPTTDEAMFNVICAKESIPKNTRVLFPLNSKKVSYVQDKSNIPLISKGTGVKTPLTYALDGNLKDSDIEVLRAPYVVKKAYGVAGDGFKKIDSRGRLKEISEEIKNKCPGEKHLLQEYISGTVYGVCGVFEDKALRRFFSYKYIRKHPSPSGPATIWQADYNDRLEDAMYKILSFVEWNGFCQMDFIMEDKTGVPYIIDINPVHWYGMPNSMKKEFSCLEYYVNDKHNVDMEDEGGFYTTISLYKELQRILGGGVFKKSNLSTGSSYWHCMRGLRYSDFFWDPLPIMLAPFLRVLRRYS